MAKPALKKATQKAPAKKATVELKSASTADLEAYVAADMSAKSTDGSVLTKKAAKDLVRSVIEGICSLTANNGRLQIADLGIFNLKTTPARQGHNPRTGEALQIKESKTVSFRPAKSLKEYVRQ